LQEEHSGRGVEEWVRPRSKGKSRTNLAGLFFSRSLSIFHQAMSLYEQLKSLLAPATATVMRAVDVAMGRAFLALGSLTIVTVE
jgi:hypothetical protein